MLTALHQAVAVLAVDSLQFLTRACVIVTFFVLPTELKFQ